MKLPVLVATVLAALAPPPGFAQPAQPVAGTLAQQAARRFPQPVAAGALAGRTVLQPLESQPILGTVTAIVQRPDGALEAVLRYGAVLGLGGRPIAVPLDAMTLLGAQMEVVGFTPKQLDAFPRFDPASAQAVPPGMVLHVGLSRPSH